MRVARATAVLVVVVLAGCGQEPESRVSFPSVGLSAFEHRRQPEGVKHDIPFADLVKGMPAENPKDLIKALFAPRFVPAHRALPMRDDDRVIVLRVGADVRAYPTFLLDAHEVVNDRVGGLPGLVTWCPLCGSAAVFERTVAGVERTFGVSGYLWRSDVLLYDQQSESFWSQIDARAVVGPLTGERLTLLPSEVSSRGAFRVAHPDGRVLTPDSTDPRAWAAYRADNYASYRATPDLFPGTAFADERLARKEEVVGVVAGGKAHAWSLAYLRRNATDTPVEARVGGRTLRLAYRAEGDVVSVGEAGSLAPVPHLRCYWFAWALFHPDTGLTGGRPQK
jgi:hypothetical protein